MAEEDLEIFLDDDVLCPFPTKYFTVKKPENASIDLFELQKFVDKYILRLKSCYLFGQVMYKRPYRDWNFKRNEQDRSYSIETAKKK